MTSCCKSSFCMCCQNCFFCWRGLFFRDEFLLDNFYEEITPQEWNALEKEAGKIKGEVTENIVLVKTNVSPSITEEVATSSAQETPISSRSLVDRGACDIIEDLETSENESTKTPFNTKYFRCYTEPWFATEMWKNPGKTRTKMKSFKEIFQRRRYSRFLDEQNDEDSSDDKRSAVESKVKLRTKILTRRSQRQSQEKEPTEGSLSRSLSPSYMFNDHQGHIETSISFAAHVRRQGPGFSASCTQTLRTSDFTSIGDLFESEVHSNVTFNPLFEDDDSEDEEYVKRTRPRRYRLYTIDEESESFDSN
ncbi:uncharacterized protein LOC111336062 [Stylophora pistillata]|uniref:uncharacterized protein LOC111336062 n=1 Tax=Stylophora pistillata TaxID=50429 RepID=UPI000C039A34|nr:uncharacterized protein LOC111336062 [Stylophora pistillata]